MNLSFSHDPDNLMKNSKMSAVINNQGQNFLAEWTTNVTRAGVIVNAPFCFNDTNISQECISVNDSFSAQFAPLQFSNSSSCISLDSLHNEPLLDVHILNGKEQPAFDINDVLTSDLRSNVTQHTFSPQNGLLCCNNEAVKKADEKITCDHALMLRLEQLREWQQERQEQLKKQHLEQLQQLVHKQQTLLGLIGTQQGFTGFPVPTENSLICQRSCLPQPSTVGLLGLSSKSPSMHSEHVLKFQTAVCVDASTESSAINGRAFSLNGSTSETLCNLDDMEKIHPVKIVRQREEHTEQENAVLEGENEVHDEPNSGCSFSREPLDTHQSNKDFTSATFFQNPSEKDDSNDPPSFTTLEERPIKPGVDTRKETFEEFLEQQMRMEEQRLKQQQLKLEQPQLHAVFSEDKGNQKRKFLKRGEGLARFSKVKSSNLASIKADKETNVTNQKVPDSQSSMKTTRQQMQRKFTLLNKENHNGGSTKVSNKPKAVGKGKNNSAVCVKKVTDLGNSDGDNAFQSPLKMQAEKKISVPVGKVQDIHKTVISCKTESVNIVQKCEQSTTKQIGQGSIASDGLTSVHNAERLQTNEGNIVPMWPCNRAATGPEYAFEVSFQKKLENWNKEKENENIELNEFEFLEQAAEELSFSSNSSFVLKMVQHDWQYNKGRRLSSTPIKSEQHQVAENSSGPMNNRSTDFEIKENVYLKNHDILEHSVRLEENFRSVFASPVSDEVAFKNVECDPQEDEYSNYDTISDSEVDDLDSTLTNDKKNKHSVVCSSDKEDDPKSNCGKQPTDILHKDKNMDTDLDLSSSDDDDDIEMPTVIENKKLVLSQKPDSSLFNSKCKSSSPLHREKTEFDDDQTWADLEEAGFINHEDNSSEPVNAAVLVTQGLSSGKSIEDKVMRRKIASAKKGEAVDERNMNKSTELPPTSDLITRLFPSLKPKPGSLQGLGQKLKAANDKPLGGGIQSKLLRDKLVELESEINQFRAENATLAKLRDDREKAMVDLKKEIADFERKKTEEITQLEEYKKEELKRLQKERKIFEKYTAAARAIPDKKEREEIQVLKQQIVDLQEELKRKELRWSSTHTRLRNQIDILTKENLELRDEVKIMERLRLETWKKTEAVIEKKTEASPPQRKKMELVTSPRDVKLSPAVKSSAPGVTRNSLKESSASLTSSISLNNVTDTTVAGMIHSEPSENFPSCGKVSAPDSSSLKCNGAEDEIQEEIKYPDGKVEQVLRSGNHIIIFCNGTRKEISADGKTITVTFFNGDVKQMMSDQTVIYYYAGAQTTHTTYPDGLEVLQFPNNQMEKHYPDGRKEIIFPDQTIKYLFTDGHEDSVFPDGTIIRVQPDGNKIIEFNNGQREIHTSNYKRREYPDGTVKTVYLNGQQETKYSSGRIRIKDKEGNVIMDSKPQ
ncbi:centromere protein J isoform X2 [Heptranchias perlo]|uniref:centromere protein J isoform X2 n=1 Tax=Heptranchias perlo TaxID=212740 RepID=UPI0035593879